MAKAALSLQSHKAPLAEPVRRFGAQATVNSQTSGLRRCRSNLRAVVQIRRWAKPQYKSSKH
jgi:hypothetical protein